MTTQKLVDELEVRRLAAQQALGVLGEVSQAPGAIAADAILEKRAGQALGALGSASPAPGPAAVQSALSSASDTTSAPAQDAAPVPGAPKPATASPLTQSEDYGSFYDMLLRNDAYRLQNKEAFERNERANRARTTIAAVSDALASLGNLVGTTRGAFSQPQTYQTPFVTEQVEADRTRARTLADKIQASDQTIRLAKAREDLTNGTYALRKELEEEKTRRAQLNNDAKADLETQKQEGRMELEKFKQGGRVSLKQMDIDYKQNKDELQAALRRQGINISSGRLQEMIRHNQTIEKIRENGGGGSVGGYETIIIRDEFGREIRRKRVPLGGSVDLDDDPAPWTSSGESGGESAPWMS